MHLNNFLSQECLLSVFFMLTPILRPLLVPPGQVVQHGQDDHEEDDGGNDDAVGGQALVDDDGLAVGLGLLALVLNGDVVVVGVGGFFAWNYRFFRGRSFDSGCCWGRR